MDLRIKDPKKVIAGLIYVIFGTGTFVWSQQYPLGTATRMGPGYFPALLGMTLVVIGFATLLSGLLTKAIGTIKIANIEPLLLVLASVVSFGLLINRAGLIISSFVCIALACFRRLLTNPIEVLFTFVIITGVTYAIFIYAFGISIPLFLGR